MRQAGPFALIEPVGRGGMGVVWRAVHEPSGTPAAVKTLGDQPRSAAWRAQFRREVQAVARLAHPSVVAVLDAGLDEEPWMAMELATGGTLATRTPQEWPAILAVTRTLLDGLGFAHARGVIHRDLKPSNVLFASPADALPGWKLADFGIAQLAHEGQDARPQSGTPGYMAPEQLRGAWREVGPATDLYALGALVWQLVTGGTPFAGELAALTYAHLHLPPPPLAPRIAVPAGLEAWLRRCLGKAPSERFGRAAEARAALDALGEPVHIAADAQAAAAWSATVDLFTATETSAPPPPETLPPPAVEPVAVRPPPLPARPSEAPPRPRALAGAGLGLYALKVDRLVGRESECARLWALARAAEADGRPRLTLIRGPSGAGKSALARWLTEAVHEAGGAAYIATHAEQAPVDGLGNLLRTATGAVGLDGEALVDHVRRWGGAHGLAPLDVARTLERIAPGLAHPLPQVGPLDREARHTAVDAALVADAAGRVAAVWLDDLQWGEEALDWAAGAGERFGCQAPDGGCLAPAGLLIVATVQEEALAAHPTLAARLAALEAEGVAERLELGPLPAARWPGLVAGLLDLDPVLAERVAARTHGNPLFARELVGDWVSRGILRAGPQGFALAAGAEIGLPDSLAQVWERRIAQLAGEVGAEGRAALHLAATLGVEVDGAGWRASCAALGVAPEAAPLGEWVRAAWIRPAAHGWSFAHGMLREALLAGLDPQTRRALHRSCARGLDEVQHELDRAEAIARHHLAAGEQEAALRPLWQAAFHRQRRHDLAGARALLAERTALLERLALPPTHVAWAEGWAQEARLLSSTGLGHLATEAYGRAVAWAEEHGWNRWLANAGAYQSCQLALAGRIDEATALADRVEAEVQGETDRALVLLARAIAALARRRFAACRALLDEAEALGPSPAARAELHRMRIASWALDGRVDEATAAYTAMRAWLGDTPRAELANAEEAMGVAHHVREEWPQALAYYERCCATYRALGGEAPGTALNICLIRAHQGALDELEPELSMVRARLLDSDPSRRACLACVDLRVAAARADQAGLDAVAAELETLLARSGLVDTDVAGLARKSAAVAEARGLEVGRLRAIAAAQAAALAG